MSGLSWDWSLDEIKKDKPVKVFTTFSCGGGSSLGYKRAGFDVIGNVEIDPKMNALYVLNNKPKYNYFEDLREFNKREDLPEELYKLDILDGSPPCTSFSSAGVRERDWGKVKKFREGQVSQTLDDLFSVFLDTVEKLRPRIVIAENVVGIIKKNARGYVNEVFNRFRALGYKVQVFSLNSAMMDTPQARHRVFFIANRCCFPALKLDFKGAPILFGDVRTNEGVEVTAPAQAALIMQATEKDFGLDDVVERLSGHRKYFGCQIVHDNQVCFTVTGAGSFFRYADRKLFAPDDFRRVQTFPRDYDFKGENVQYVCGMSVPPNMMANVAGEVWKQWLE